VDPIRLSCFAPGIWSGQDIQGKLPDSLEKGNKVPHGDPKHTATLNKHIKFYSENLFSALYWWTSNRLFRVTVCFGSPWGTLWLTAKKC